jgi:DNA-binding NarL/FixJ family response regulator
MPDTHVPVRIAIADDHHIFSEGLKRLLMSERGFAIVGQAANGYDAISVVEQLHPDVLLLDVAMPSLGGVEALSSIDTERIRVLLLTAGIEATDLLRAIELGARGVVLKEAAPEQLLQAIYDVMRGKYVLGSSTAENLADAVRRVRSDPGQKFGLTTRELEIVAAIVDGQSNRDIATALHITLATVKNHLTNIFDKTGVSSRLELAMFALRQSLLQK